MKIMLDTNVLISAFVFGGNAGKLLQKLILSEHEQAERVYELFHSMSFHFCESTVQRLGSLRDEKDVPVLSDALYHKVDLILTGDKDFLEAHLCEPLIFSPSMLYEYLEQYERKLW